MIKFIKFGNRLLDIKSGNYFSKSASTFIVFSSVLNSTVIDEMFETEQERDARWQELESMLLDKVTPEKETKTYWIGIYQDMEAVRANELNTMVSTLPRESKIHAENDLTTRYRFIKTIEVEL